MDEERPILPWIIFLSAIALVAVFAVWQFSSAPAGRLLEAVRHPLAGKWHNDELGTLIIYDDRWAIANGLKCRWEPADGSAIRIELHLKEGWANLPPVNIMADFRLRPENGGGQAILNFMGQDLIFERREDKATNGTTTLP